MKIHDVRLLTRQIGARRPITGEMIYRVFGPRHLEIVKSLDGWNRDLHLVEPGSEGWDYLCGHLDRRLPGTGWKHRVLTWMRRQG